MAKLIVSMVTSVDGYIEKPGGQFVPPPWSDEVERHWPRYALDRAAHLVYGRINFFKMKDFWAPAETDPTSIAASISYAKTMNSLPKTLVSRSFSGDPGWNGTLAKGDLAATITALKASVKGDIFCFGGAGLVNSLVALDLPDEYRLMIAPVLFGDGKKLFEAGADIKSLPDLPLTRTECIALDTGSIILHYRRDR